MPHLLVASALERGALIVTPNKRLAREIASAHDRAQVAAGHATWPAARVLPWMTFVDDLVQKAQDAALAVPPLALDVEQSAHLWRRVIASDLAQNPLVSVDAMAQTAIEAWSHVHGYGSGPDSWRGVPAHGADTEAFARWATDYARATARLDALDTARSADAVAAIAASLPGVAQLDVTIVGFVELAPQQHRLMKALASSGARVEIAEAGEQTSVSPHARLGQAVTPRDELIAALDWAREQAASDENAQVAIVVQDLTQRQAIVRRLAEDRLCPDLQRPGHHNAARPYDISLGAPLASVPLVACALDLLTIAQRPLPRDRATVLLRSPYLPDATTSWIRRASLERKWLDLGIALLSLKQATAALRSLDDPLAIDWQRIVDGPRPPQQASPRAWVEHWRSLLEAFGWAQGSALDTAEFQAQSAWHELLARFVRLSTVAPQLSRDEALATLARLAGEQLFQPEARGARIRILGLLESAGLTFDALWITGMAADAWPRPPSPNPLLPIRWQRERNVPRSSPAQELAFARRVTAMLSHAAPRVVFSYASQADEHVRAPSPLIATLARLEVHAPPTTAERLLLEQPLFVRCPDARAPAALAGALLPGGTAVIEDQSTCAFRFVVKHRLRAREWPAAAFGLTYIERGMLVHATMAAFWQGVHDHATLVALSDDEVEQRIASAVAAAMPAIDRSRWEAVPPAVAQSEAACLKALVREWLVLERERPPFTVAASELTTTVALAGYTFNVRLDRIDSLEGGGVAVIDYKSGIVEPVTRWFEARPRALQLAVYAAAQNQRDATQPVRALVYGRLKRGEIAPVGLAASAGIWPGVSAADEVKVAGVKLADWHDALGRLDEAIVRLAQASGEGEASVAPRHPSVCRLCHLRAVCRVGAALSAEDSEDVASLDDA
jgi:ATP-dependent helicase/nuclease subunit B